MIISDDDDALMLTMIHVGRGGERRMTRDYDNALTMSEVIHVTGQIH